MKKTLSALLITACWQLPASAQINWTPFEGNPVIDRSFDIESQATYRPSVVKWQDKYHMWYGKLWLQTRWVAYTRSVDGIEWDNSSPEGFDNAVLGPSSTQGTFDETEASYGSVVLDGDTLKMWYAGRGNQGNGIGLAWSVDGKNWTKVPGPAFGNSVLDPDADGAGAVVITLPTVVKHDGMYHMWYSRISPTNTALGFASNLGYARSADGLSWQVISGSGSNGAALDNGDGSAFDSIALLYPTALHNGDYFEMWYQGVGFDPFLQFVSRVGCARSNDGVSWEKLPGPQAEAGACFNSLAQPFVLLDGDVYKMWYALSAVDPNDDVVQYATSARTSTAAEDDELPSLRQTIGIYPNPAVSRTHVQFRAERQAAFVLEVHDMLGRSISRVDLGPQPTGDHTVIWPITDGRGSRVPAGAYVLTVANLSTGERSAGGIVHVLR